MPVLMPPRAAAIPNLEWLILTNNKMTNLQVCVALKKAKAEGERLFRKASIIFLLLLSHRTWTPSPRCRACATSAWWATR